MFLNPFRAALLFGVFFCWSTSLWAAEPYVLSPFKKDAESRYHPAARVGRDTSSPFLLPVGGMYTGAIYGYACEDASGYPIATTVTFTPGSLPAALQAKCSIRNPSNLLIDYEVQTVQTISANNSAQLGNHGWFDTVATSNCASGSTHGNGTIGDGVTVVPGIKIQQPVMPLNPYDPNYIFWFEGSNVETPTPFYPTTAQLVMPDQTAPANGMYTQISASSQPFTWTIPAGTNKLEFWNSVNDVSLESNTVTTVTTVTGAVLDPVKQK